METKEPFQPRNFCASLAFLAGLFVTGAEAGDLAQLEVIGFSEDGSAFAYQESGVQDGSGFPYANIFVLDLGADRFMPPSPIRILMKDETMTRADAVAEARGQAAGLLAEQMADPSSGKAVVENLPTDLTTDSKAVRFVFRPILPPIDEPIELRLETFALSGPEFCRDIASTRGYRLTRIGLAEGEAAHVLHADTALPVSRGCPFDYAIRQMRVFVTPAGDAVAVAIIAVQSFGFEGPDTRHIAVPVPLD